VTTGYQYQGGNPLYLSAIAAGVELPALLQLIHECCQAIQVVQFVMHTLGPLKRSRPHKFCIFNFISYIRLDALGIIAGLKWLFPSHAGATEMLFSVI
jgi:hypothetical protein